MPTGSPKPPRTLPSDHNVTPWKDHLKSSTRSVLVELHNKTNKKLIRSEYELPSGQWAQPPPECLDPLVKCDFGVFNRESLLPNVTGFVSYYIEGDKGKDAII
jgi:hypothetical protein